MGGCEARVIHGARFPPESSFAMNATASSPFRLLHHVCIVVQNLAKAVAYYDSWA
jgi:hypothetical protein